MFVLAYTLKWKIALQVWMLESQLSMIEECTMFLLRMKQGNAKQISKLLYLVSFIFNKIFITNIILLVLFIAFTLFISDVPQPPEGPLEISDVTESSIKLSWRDPVYDGGAPITSYTVEKREIFGSVWMPISEAVTRFVS